LDRITLAIILGTVAVCLAWIALIVGQGNGHCLGIREFDPTPAWVHDLGNHRDAKLIDYLYWLQCSRARHQLWFELGATVLAGVAVLIWLKEPTPSKVGGSGLMIVGGVMLVWFYLAVLTESPTFTQLRVYVMHGWWIGTVFLGAFTIGAYFFFRDQPKKNVPH
jgi:hypothetical protein